MTDPEGAASMSNTGCRPPTVKSAAWSGTQVRRDAHGRTCGVRSAGIDLTARYGWNRSSRSLGLLDRTTDAVLVYRYEADRVCERHAVQRGCDLKDLIGVNMRTLIPHSTLRRSRCICRRSGRVRPRCSRRIRVSRRFFRRSRRTRAVRVGDAEFIVDVSRDITERRGESTVRGLAYTDHLTGLPNRALSPPVGYLVARDGDWANTSPWSSSTSMTSRASTTRSARRRRPVCRPSRSGRQRLAYGGHGRRIGRRRIRRAARITDEDYAEELATRLVAASASHTRSTTPGARLGERGV